MKDSRGYQFGIRIFLVLVLALLAGAGFYQQRWKPAQYGELVAGKSTRKDVLRVLGNATPKKSGSLESYSYPGKGDFGGEVIVEVSGATGIVESVIVQFSPNITRTQARKKYGDNYREVRYSISDCPHDSILPLAYRDTKGGVELLEYPQNGLLLWPNQYGLDIAAAVYRAKELPKVKPKCRK